MGHLLEALVPLDGHGAAPDFSADRQADRASGLRLIVISGDECELSVARKRRTFLYSDRQMQRVQGSQPMVDHQGVRDGKDALRMKSEQCDWTVFAKVRFDPRQQPAPPSHSRG